jgi:hypothetical protein
MNKVAINLFEPSKSATEMEAEIASLERILGSYERLLHNRESSDPQVTRDYIEAFQSRIEYLRHRIRGLES